MAPTLANEQKWTESYEALRQYQRQHGHCNVTQSDGALGLWVSNQRARYKRRRGELPGSGRVARLEGIGFVWNANDAQWDERYRELVAYKAREGHSNVTHPYPANPLLGYWVTHQRARKGTLSKERIKRLDEIGFEWCRAGKNWSIHAPAKRRGQKEEALGKGREEHGHCNLPEKQSKSGKLVEDRAARRDRIQVEAGKDRTSWDDRFQELMAYQEKEGHCNVRKKSSPLGLWVRAQRACYKNGSLSEDRIRRLEALSKGGGEHGHCDVPRKQKPRPRDGGKGGKLVEDRAARRERIHVDVGEDRTSWDDRFQELMAYKDKEGHCNVRKKAGPLGVWVRAQRACYKNGSLSEERIGRLDGIQFAWIRPKRVSMGDFGVIGGIRVRNEKELDELGRAYGFGGKTKRQWRRDEKRKLDRLLVPSPSERPMGEDLTDEAHESGLRRIAAAFETEAMGNKRRSRLRSELMRYHVGRGHPRYSRWQHAVRMAGVRATEDMERDSEGAEPRGVGI